MATRLVDHEDAIEVPRGAGIDGLMKVVREILRRPRVKRIEIEKGKVSFTQAIQPDNPFEPLKVDLDTVMPHTIIRNCVDVKEIDVPADNAAFAVALLFRRVTMDRLVPIAFVGSSNSIIWGWHQRTTGIELPAPDELYGLPFFDDPQVEDATLFLCASTERDASLIDTQKTYKILMPERQ